VTADRPVLRLAAGDNSAENARNAVGIVGRHYLRHFAVAVAILAACYAVLTLVVDPYGISPLGLSIPLIDRYRPKRLDIDRLIKPYEVWRYQPRTVFLGTSRIHQSIDPAVLDGTPFAPAYNASVPANSLGMNISYLDEYTRLDSRLHSVFIELFLYNFLGQGQERHSQSLRQMAVDTATLFVSANTATDALYTLWYNLAKNKPCYQIMPGGYFYYPPGHDPKGTFDGFTAGIFGIDKSQHADPELSDAAFASFDQIIAAAHRHGLAATFVLTPYHPYFWSYIEAIDRWDLIRDWLARLTAKTPILSFAQPNPWTYEAVGYRMVYWNDPFHFSLAMGRGITESLAGIPDLSLPANFMQRLTPDLVPAWVAAQRAATQRWGRDNPAFIAALDAAKRKARGPAPPRP